MGDRVLLFSVPVCPPSVGPFPPVLFISRVLRREGFPTPGVFIQVHISSRFREWGLRARWDVGASAFLSDHPHLFFYFL